MQYYLMVTLSAILFAMQFLCQQKYEEKCGTGLSKALSFSLYKGLVVTVMMLILTGFQPEFEMFSFWISGLYALCYVLMIYFSLKAFSVANLSVYSVFTMLGGMVLPFILGVVFYNEGLTVFKIICNLLVVVAVLMNIRKGEGSKKAILYYMLVFTLNGSVGIISKVHESALIAHTGPQSFMMYSGIWTIIICCIWLLKTGNKIPLLKGTELICSAGDGVFNGMGDLLLLMALAKLPASVQYPLITGGVMVFSTIISMIRREKLKPIEYAAAVVAFIASVMMAF